MVKELMKLFVACGIIGGISVAPGMIKTEKVVEPNLDLPTVGTVEKLKELVKKSNDGRNYRDNFYTLDGMLTFNSKSTSEMALTESAVSDTISDDYSTTNVQVEGVDEADIIKNDGKYLYHLLNNELIVSEINPTQSMKVASKISYDKEFDLRELYIDKDLVIVIGNYYKREGNAPRYYGGEQYTKVIIYDAKDKTNLKEVKQVEVSGFYNSSRKIDSALYLVAQKGINYYMFDDGFGVMPLYRDTAVSQDVKEVSCEDIAYFPEFECTQYMMTVGIDLDNLKSEANISTYLGNSESIYSSKDNMYVTFTSYDADSSRVEPLENDTALRRIITPINRLQSTSIYRFKLEDGKMNCKATGKVPGSILNQFSMDESNGYFRIATTKGSVTGVGENASKNNMYVLDMDLKQVGAIEDIAPGEKIYSVRYMGNRAYMVTFRKVDPLFVIDLSTPDKPEILGKLKIPGYSDYLHPYDENHIIGFGKDAAVVANEEGSWGWVDEDNTAAYYQGMKIAMFDVTDPTNPIEMWKEEIGDRGTESELLNNHKALLFSKERNLLAFPIRVAEVNDKNAKAWTYGDTTFVGAYVYELTLENGFVLKAKLTNLDENDWKRLGNYYYGDKSIDRLVYIGNNLYTIANSGYAAYDMNNNYEKVGELKLEE